MGANKKIQITILNVGEDILKDPKFLARFLTMQMSLCCLIKGSRQCNSENKQKTICFKKQYFKCNLCSK